MKKYQYVGEEERSFPSLGIVVNRGDTFETDRPVNHPELVEVTNSEPQGEEQEQVV